MLDDRLLLAIRIKMIEFISAYLHTDMDFLVSEAFGFITGAVHYKVKNYFDILSYQLIFIKMFRMKDLSIV